MLKRYWINQPFKNQKFHDLHGKKVLADIKETNDGICECYFTNGDIVSQKIEYMALSPDWPETPDHRILEDDEKIVVSIAKMDEILRNWINEADKK